MIVRNVRAASWLLAGLALGGAAGVQAQSQTFIYPSKGQTPDQQAKDKTECSGWATQQTGFDPVQALQQQHAQAAQAQQQSQQAQQQAAQQASSKDKAPVVGTLGGAAVGAGIGAIAGNAGKGAAIGAVTGLVAGAATKKSAQNSAAQQNQQTQQQIAAQQAQQRAASKQQLDNYNRAFQTCMQGRGYTVN